MFDRLQVDIICERTTPADSSSRRMPTKLVRSSRVFSASSANRGIVANYKIPAKLQPARNGLNNELGRTKLRVPRLN